VRSHHVGVWALRALWASAALVAAPAFSAALDDASGRVQVVASVGLWGAWLVGLTAVLVPSTASLTVVRITMPGLLAAAVWATLAGASGLEAGAALGLGVAVLALAVSAPVTTAFVQASAYGDESRFPLRTPGALLLGPLIVAWVVLAAGVVAGPLLLAVGQWVAGAVVLLAGWPVAWLLAQRLHRLGRRWLVLVPAGLVLHDDVVLHETAMFRAAEVAGLALAAAGTGAADLTAKAPGPAVEVTLTDLDTVVLAGTLAKKEGTALHVRTFLVAPLRPGQVLAEADRRRLRVG